MPKKEIVIIGAGKIGRGYLAELFQDGGYHITFLTRSKEQAELMRAQGAYTIYRATKDEADTEEIIISGYDAFSTEAEEQKCVDAIFHTNYVALPIYPAASKTAGYLIGKAIKKRVDEQKEEPLDVLLCVNYMQGTKMLKEHILAVLKTEEEQAYFEKYVGIIETLVGRLAVDPTPEQLAKDPLSVAAGSGDNLPADADAFKGVPPVDVEVRLVERLPARFVYKIWTTNMMHFALSLYGAYAGFDYVREAAVDPYCIKCVRLAEKEASFGVATEFSMTYEEVMRDFKRDPWVTWANPNADDGFARVVWDMRRKLAKGDRVIGPALACLRGGKMPYFLARVAALALIYKNEEDETSKELHEILAREGVGAALTSFSGLSDEVEEEKYLRQLIIAAYNDLMEGEIVLQ